jgi:hypothetical protein
MPALTLTLILGSSVATFSDATLASSPSGLRAAKVTLAVTGPCRPEGRAGRPFERPARTGHGESAKIASTQ